MLQSTSQETNKEEEVRGMKVIKGPYCHYLHEMFPNLGDSNEKLR